MIFNKQFNKFTFLTKHTITNQGDEVIFYENFFKIDENTYTKKGVHIHNNQIICCIKVDGEDAIVYTENSVKQDYVLNGVNVG